MLYAPLEYHLNLHTKSNQLACFISHSSSQSCFFCYWAETFCIYSSFDWLKISFISWMIFQLDLLPHPDTKQYPAFVGHKPGRNNTQRHKLDIQLIVIMNGTLYIAARWVCCFNTTIDCPDCWHGNQMSFQFTSIRTWNNMLCESKSWCAVDWVCLSVTWCFFTWKYKRQKPELLLLHTTQYTSLQFNVK